MKIANILVENTFKYQITLSDKKVLLIIILVSYTFNLSTNLQYNNTEFKRLFIDSAAFT